MFGPSLGAQAPARPLPAQAGSGELVSPPRLGGRDGQSSAARPATTRPDYDGAAPLDAHAPSGGDRLVTRCSSTNRSRDAPL